MIRSISTSFKIEPHDYYDGDAIGLFKQLELMGKFTEEKTDTIKAIFAEYPKIIELITTFENRSNAKKREAQKKEEEKITGRENTLLPVSFFNRRC